MDPVRDCDDLLNPFLHSRPILLGHPAHIEFEIFRKAGIAGSGKRYGHDVTGVICPHGRLKIAVIALEIRQHVQDHGGNWLCLLLADFDDAFLYKRSDGRF